MCKRYGKRDKTEKRLEEFGRREPEKGEEKERGRQKRGRIGEGDKREVRSRSRGLVGEGGLLPPPHSPSLFSIPPHYFSFSFSVLSYGRRFNYFNIKQKI